MTFKTDERIYETSVTTGTGTYTLDGAATGFQAASVIGANNYGPFFITDDVNWEAVIGQYLAAPSRLTRDTVKASSNGGAAVNWAAGTRKIRCGWPAWLALPNHAARSVAGAANVTLTQAEQRLDIMEFTGALTGSIDVIVDATEWSWIVYNNTTGLFTLTVKVSGQTGVAVTQGKKVPLYNDGTDVRSAHTDAANIGGIQTLYVPASAMLPRATLPPGAGSVETATNKVMLRTLDFDAAADEFAQFSVRMPKGWDESTVTAQFVWKHAATATNFAVVWGLQGLALSDDDAADAAFGTAQTVTDTGGTTNDIYQSAATAAITIGGTPAEKDLVIFQVYRDADAGADTLAIDAGLLGVVINYNMLSLTDA